VKIAYLVNQYPKVTHSFIRREILALEGRGFEILRITIRRPAADLVDQADVGEAARTRVLLDAGVAKHFTSTLQVLLTSPPAFVRAARLALRISRSSDSGLVRHLAYLLQACVLAGWCHRWRIEHVHAHFGTNPAAVAMLCRELGGPPYSFTVHGPEEFERAGALALDAKMERAKFVVAVSRFGRTQLQQRHSAASTPVIEVIRCGLDQSFQTEAATPAGATRQLVTVGRIEAQKGHSILLDAAAQLAGTGEDFHLVIVGDGTLRGQIEAQARALGLRERIEFTGWCDEREVRRQILAARALVLASLSEGLPVVLMEALALRRPVVCTAVGGVTELVESKVCGWVVPPGSAKAMAEAMQEALNAPVEQLRRMGDEGAERVRRLHSVEHEVQKLSALLRSGVESGEADRPGCSRRPEADR
jgi:colanic acid/amylovoran biosynthesis glycosyltransferase